MPVAAPLLALALGTVGAVALTYVFEVRHARRAAHDVRALRPAGGRRRAAARGDDAPRLESRRLEATVLFCDLRGFTTLSERLEAEQVIAVLNRYLEAVSGAVFAHGGTVVSYQGDGVMAVFGAPLPQPDHAARALAAAREILDEALPRFNAWLMEERLADAPLDAGIGLNSGPRDVRASSAPSGGSSTPPSATRRTSRPACRRSGSDAEGRLFVSDTTHRRARRRSRGAAAPWRCRLRGRREPVTVWVAD